MTWQEAKLITLQKMFSAPGGRIGTDDATGEYLAAMPAAANEALLLLATVCQPLVKSIALEKTAGKEQQWDLRALADDFFSLTGCAVYSTRDGVTRKETNFSVLGERLFQLPAKAQGSYTVYYNAYPPPITAATPNDTELPASPESAALVPLYMASQLYREDDAQTAAVCRNEFETGLSRLTRGIGREGREVFESESGWCR